MTSENRTGTPSSSWPASEGQTVKEKVAQRPLKLSETLDIAIQAGEGLRAAHEKGIVHRDIKSANLMVTPEGKVKVMDFGLAQLAGQSGLTRSRSTLGTAAYMSPEQSAPAGGPPQRYLVARRGGLRDAHRPDAV